MKYLIELVATFFIVTAFPFIPREHGLTGFWDIYISGGTQKYLAFKTNDSFFQSSLKDELLHQVIHEPKFLSVDTARWPWADSLDALKAAPNSHKVLFENDKIKILEVTVEPYDFEPMHTHRYPSVMFGPDNDTSHYDIIYYRYDYDSVNRIYFAKDSIHQHSGGLGTHEHFMKPEGPHRIKNLSNVRIVAFRVEFKRS